MRQYTIKQLVSASGYPERSIRHYILEGMLPRPPYRGKDTVYSDLHLIRLRAITKLRREQKTMHRLEPLRAWFKAKSGEEIESFVTGVPLALPAPAPPPEPPPPAPAPTPASELPLSSERWLHLPLVPGMVLLVKEGAPAIVTRLAAEIREKYGA